MQADKNRSFNQSALYNKKSGLKTEIKLQMPPDTSKDLHEMQQHYYQQRWQTVWYCSGSHISKQLRTTNSIAAELNDKQKAGLQYNGG